MTESVRRPVLRYHGGKWNLAPWIIAHFPAHRVYVEPFGGVASVLLRKPRAYAEIWNDVDDQIANLFRVLRDSELSDRLGEQIRLTPFARSEFQSSFERADCPVEWARRTIVRSYMGHGTTAIARETVGFRGDAGRDRGTTPAQDWANYPKRLAHIVNRLRGVTIECRPAVQVLQRHDGHDTLHYVDPPYVNAARSSLRKGRKYNHELTDEDHSELANVLHEVDGAVVLSGYPSVLYQDLYGDWTKVERTALADGARKRTEVLWLNEKASSGIQMDLLEKGA